MDLLTTGLERLALRVGCMTPKIADDPGVKAIFANYFNMQAEMLRLQSVVGKGDFDLIEAALKDSWGGLKTWEAGHA